jgi:hypothetical protein
MADEIIVKVRADVDGLQADVNNAKKILEPLELLDKEYKPKINISNLQQLEKTINKIALSSGEVWDEAAFKKKISESINDSKKLSEIRNQFVAMANVADKADASFDLLMATIKGLDTQIEFINNNPVEVKVNETPVRSLRTQIRAAQQEVAELSLKFGATSKEATEAALRASALKDRLEDAKNLTDAFNPDAKFKALSGSLQGVAGGFTAVQGAIGAFGTKSEDVEKALLKVNSAMALSQGLQSVGESVDSFKNLGAVIKNTTAFQFLYNAATATATAVQTAFGVATTATSTGFKVLRGAIMATGIGALVVGLGLVVSNFDSISAWIKNSPLGSFANQVGNLVQRFTDFVGVTSEAERASDRLAKANSTANKQIENRIKLLKAQGGSEKEIATLQKQAVQNEINVLNSKKNLSDEEKQTRENLKNDLLVIDAEYNKKVQDDQKKANEKVLEKQKENNAKLLKIREEYQKNLEDLRKKGREGESADIQKLIDENQKAIQEIENDRLGSEKAELQAVDDKYFELITKAKLYNGKSKALEDAVANFTNRKEKEKADIKAKYLKERQDAENKQLEDQKKVDEISRKNFQDAENDKAETLKQKFELQKAQLNEILTIAQNGILLKIGLNPQEVERVKSGILNAMTVIKDNQKVLDNVNATAAQQSKARLENLVAVSQAIASGVSTISNAIFASDTARREQELSELKTKQDEELRLAGDNEQKKEIIRQKYALKERELKRKQAEADKRKALFDATVNTAVAVISAFASGGPLLAAIAGVLGAAQIALIAAQPIPKFAKGGAVPSSDIQGMIDGRPHASGGVLIEAEGNEFITRKSQAMKGENLGLLEAINMSDSERDAYINRHYVMPALKAKESKANESYRHSMIEAENNLIARVSSSTLKSIDRRLVETNQSIKGLAKMDYKW